MGLSVVGLIATAGAQTFELVQPEGVVTGRIEVARGRLVVYELGGQRIFFSRERRYDSPDGLFAGYFQFELNRILRFPRSGRGAMQTADLDDRFPRFRLTRRFVRPISSAIAPPVLPLPGFVDPIYPAFPVQSPVLIPQPQSLLIDTQSIPNPPLPPARVRLTNGGPRDVQVTLVDLKTPSRNRSMRIAPNRSSDVMLERDAGGKQVQTYRVITPGGEAVTRERTVAIAVPPRYEIVVHQWQVQSVAIDRTAGAADNPIEDIHYQGEGIGRFPLPPGPELESGTIDVYHAAKASGTRGAVVPILASEDDNSQSPSPIERAILEAQQRASRGR